MIEEILEKRIEEALRELSYPSDTHILIERPRDPRYGDYATPIAFALAKRFGENPSSIAEKILSVIQLDRKEVKEISVAGGGFINFTLSKDYYISELYKIFDQGKEYGKMDLGKGEKVIVEFVSSNPTGPLTVGHGRQAVLGDVLSNILSETGFQVSREYYFNDAGRQMDLLGKSCFARYMQEFDPSYEFPDGGYAGDYLIDIARKAVNEYGDRFARAHGEEREGAIGVMREFASREIVSTIDADLRKMGIKFDSWFNESSLLREGKVEEAIDMLKKAGAAYEKEGALWFRASEYGDEEDRVLIKSNGDPTYFMTDIAYHINKHERDFPLMINIHGADHHGYVPRMKAAMKALGFPEDSLRYLVHQMVTFIEGGEKMKMSTRAGAFVTLRELMEKVGVDSTRYFFVMRRADSHLVFDIDLAKKRNLENPVFYVQYAYARISNVFDFARSRGIDINCTSLREGFDAGHLAHDDEWTLVRLLSDYPAVLKSAATHLEPHRLTGYLEEVAGAFHHWYQTGDREHDLRIVTEELPTTKSRLFLSSCAMNIISKGLTLLGVSLPARM